MTDAHSQPPTARPGFLAALRGELERAHEREQAASSSRAGRARPRGRRIAAIATASTLLVAGGAVAATGLFQPGTVIEGRIPDGPTPDLQPPISRMTVDQTIAATGTFAGGTWQLRTHASERVANPETGEVYQPTGLPCLRLVLIPAPTSGSLGSGGCGREGFRAGTHPVAVGDRTEVLLYGRAPKRAAKVVLTGAGGTEIEVATHAAPDAGRVWLMEAPVGLSDAQVRWVAADGTRSAPDDVSDELEPGFVDARLGR